MSDTSTAPEPGLLPVPTGREVLADSDVRNFIVANVLIYTGVALQLALVGKEVFDITGRESDLAWLGFAEFLPAPFLVFVTGAVADRFDRKKVAALAIGGELLCIVALALYSSSKPTAAWPFFVIAGVFGAFRSFNAPAVRAMPPMVAPAGALPRVIALFSATFTGATIIGAAVSGLLYVISPWVGYAVAATLVAVGLAWLMVVRFRRQPPPPDPETRPTLKSAMEGIAFIRRTPILLSIISLDLFAVLLGGAVALLPAIAEDRLHVGDVAYGWLRAAPGIGAAAMAVFLSARPLRRRVGRSLLIAVAVFGAGTVVLGFTHNFAVAFAALLVLTGADMVSVFVRTSLVPLVTPDEKRGRVLAVENVFIGASNELGAFESGMAAQQLGLFPAVAGGGAATMLVVAGFWFFFPTIRRIDRFEDLVHAENNLPTPGSAHVSAP